MRLMRFARVATCGVLLSLMLAACAPVDTRPSATETAAAQDAAAMARQGQLDAAAQAYVALAADAGTRADHYRLLAAEAWRQAGELDRATATLAQIDRRNLVDDEPLRLDLLRAESALAAHDLPTALRLTTQPKVPVPDTLRPRLLELRARAMAASADYWGAARTRAEMQEELSGLDRTQNQKQILALLAKVGSADLQQRAAAMRPGDRMLPWIEEALTQQGITVARAQPQLQQPVGTMLPGADANVREGYKVPQHLALLLPTDGTYADAGAAIVEGFFAAYLDAGRNHAPRPSVRVYNSHGTAAGAVSGYQQAVNDGAQLVVGPLTRGEVSAVFSQPKLAVPLLALNHPDDRQLPASGVSEFGLLPETEGAQAADHMIERGLRHAYTVVGNDDFAQRALKAFKAELAARGGQVDGNTLFVTGATALSGLDLANAASDAGIFISMRPAQARVLVPQLRAAGITLPVIATSHVYDATADASANRDLEGVEFCDGPWLFDAQPGLPSHADLAARLPSASGTSARLFAFGMDAWHLVPYLDWLRANPGSYLPGATGQLTTDQFGRVRRVLIWATFRDGLARPLGGALQMDDVPSAAPPPIVDPYVPPVTSAKSPTATEQ
ncbi:MAG: penicillin-binding protein activator [Rhodanobacter sp.]